MVLAVVSIILSLALVMTSYLACITFKSCQSAKRYYFVICLVTVLVHIFGYLLQITATSVGAALIGAKVMYIGNAFMPVTFLLFVMDYYGTRLRRSTYLILRTVLVTCAAAISALILTADRHSLMFVNYYFDVSTPLRGLRFTPGVLLGSLYLLACVSVGTTVAVLIRRMLTRGSWHRRTMLFLILSAVVPLVADGVFTYTSIIVNPDGNILNFMPFMLVFIDVIFYYTVVRHSLFDFVPVAYSSVLDSIDYAFIILDPMYSCAAVNAAGQRLFSDIAACRDGVSVTTCEGWPEALSDLSQIDRSQDTLFTREENDKLHHYSATVDTIREHGKLLGYTIVIKDITSRQELLVQLEHAAYTDALTGIYNRRHFLELANKEFDKSKRFGSTCFAMVFDLDYFKKVNDTYGHAAGDEVLRSVSARVRNTVRTYDLFARYGGEEFVILLPSTSETTISVAETLAERIRVNVSRAPCIWEGYSIPVTVSIGIADGKDSTTLYDLLRNADEAMYTAKQAGRNRSCVYIKPDDEPHPKPTVSAVKA